MHIFSYVYTRVYLIVVINYNLINYYITELLNYSKTVIIKFYLIYSLLFIIKCECSVENFRDLIVSPF